MWNAEAELRQIWNAAIAAVDPLNVVARHLPARPKGRLVIVGAGKAAAKMAHAAEKFYGSDLEGLMLTRYGYKDQTISLKVVEAGHPVPDAAGQAAAERSLEFAHSLNEGDCLLVLLSGGASALLALPAEGVTLADKQAVTRALLASGAPISAINTVRKHISRIKGGRLAAAAWPAQTITLAISDVPGDDQAVIGSGPTIGDPTTLEDARRVLADYKIDVPPSVRAALDRAENESIKPGDRRLSRATYRLIAGPDDALNAAKRAAAKLGYRVKNLGSDYQGEAKLVADEHARFLRPRIEKRLKAAIISGGELTVTGAPGEVAGGRCREYALAFAAALGPCAGVAALAADTDGIDGTNDAAGAFVLPGDLEASRQAGRDPRDYLKAHRSGDYFAALGRQLVTGPTFTNVGDLRVILVNPTP